MLFPQLMTHVYALTRALMHTTDLQTSMVFSINSRRRSLSIYPTPTESCGQWTRAASPSLLSAADIRRNTEQRFQVSRHERRSWSKACNPCPVSRRISVAEIREGDVARIQMPQASVEVGDMDKDLRHQLREGTRWESLSQKCV